MKRDFDAIRKVLLYVEEGENHLLSYEEPSPIEGVPRATLDYHLALLVDAGFVDADDHPLMTGDEGHTWLIRSLSWAGHDFLDTIRDDSIWKATLKKVGGPAGTAALEVVKQIAISYAKQHFGI